MLLRILVFAGCSLGCIGWATLETATGQKKNATNAETAAVGKIGLKGYHAKVVRSFGMAPGFGVVRMPRFYLKVKDDTVQLSLSELDKISPLNDHPELVKANKGFNSFFATGKKSRKPPFTGYIRLAEKADGKTKKRDRKSKIWRIDSIDLVGLMDRNNPLVYETRNIWAGLFPKKRIPANQHAQKAKNREGKPLPKNARRPDLFEWAGLDYLEKDKDLFVYANDKSLRMLGALRATKQCARCHDVKEGALLGALSYTMRKER